MRVLTRPHVEVAWDVRFRGVEHLHFPRANNHAVNVGAFAAKVCYRSFNNAQGQRSAESNQRHVVIERHGKILQHMNYGLYISGVSRALGNELITHQAGVTISQESTRYVDASELGIVLDPDQADVYERLGLDPDSCTTADQEMMEDLLASAERSWQAYGAHYHYWYLRNPYNIDTSTRAGKTALEKFARGKARNLLPLNLETTLVMTANLRAFRHLIEMRSPEGVEAEFRRLTHAIFLALQQEAPLYFEDYEAENVRGFPVYTTQNRKV